MELLLYTRLQGNQIKKKKKKKEKGVNIKRVAVWAWDCQVEWVWGQCVTKDTVMFMTFFVNNKFFLVE